MIRLDEFYAPLAEKLSQGDILRNVPWGLIDAPLTLCRPADRKLDAGKASYGPAKGRVDAFKGQEFIHAVARRSLAMVMWHDCQIDKFENQGKPAEKWFTSVAPVLPCPATEWENVFAGRRRAFFPVPRFDEGGITENSYVDLRHMWPLKQSLLGERVITLSERAREALYAQLFSFLTQRALRESVNCPSCGSALAVRDLTPALAEP